MLSLGGGLTLLKVVVIGLPIYWFSMAQIPKSIQYAIRGRWLPFFGMETMMVGDFTLQIGKYCTIQKNRVGGI